MQGEEDNYQATNIKIVTNFVLFANKIDFLSMYNFIITNDNKI